MSEFEREETERVRIGAEEAGVPNARERRIKMESRSLPQMSFLNIFALSLLIVIGLTMIGIVFLTYTRLTVEFAPLRPEGNLQFSDSETLQFIPGQKVEIRRVYCNTSNEELTGGLSATFVQEETNKQIPGGGLTAVYPEGCFPHVVELTISKELTPGTWRLVRSVIVLKGNRFQQVTSESPPFEVVAGP